MVPCSKDKPRGCFIWRRDDFLRSQPERRIPDVPSLPAVATEIAVQRHASRGSDSPLHKRSCRVGRAWGWDAPRRTK